MNVNLTKELLGDEEEADLVEWLVDNGATVQIGQTIASFETSKLVNDLVAPASGVITLKKAAGDVVSLDETVATIE